MASNARRAARLADGALSSFRQAHGDLTLANELHTAEIEYHDAEAQRHEDAVTEHHNARVANAKVIRKLADFLG